MGWRTGRVPRGCPRRRPDRARRLGERRASAAPGARKSGAPSRSGGRVGRGSGRACGGRDRSVSRGDGPERAQGSGGSRSAEPSARGSRTRMASSSGRRGGSSPGPATGRGPWQAGGARPVPGKGAGLGLESRPRGRAVAAGRPRAGPSRVATAGPALAPPVRVLEPLVVAVGRAGTVPSAAGVGPARCPGRGTSGASRHGVGAAPTAAALRGARRRPLTGGGLRRGDGSGRAPADGTAPAAAVALVHRRAGRPDAGRVAPPARPAGVRRPARGGAARRSAEVEGTRDARPYPRGASPRSPTPWPRIAGRRRCGSTRGRCAARRRRRHSGPAARGGAAPPPTVPRRRGSRGPRADRAAASPALPRTAAGRGQGGLRRRAVPDAAAILAPLAAEVPSAASVRELLGLTCYCLGQWRKAAGELKAYRRLTGR